MRKDMLFIGLILAIFLGFLYFYPHYKEPKYDCIEDYCGWVVADYDLGDVFIIKKGCEYREIKLPSYYNYSIRDTICNISSIDRLDTEITEIRRQTDSVLESLDKYQ